MGKACSNVIERVLAIQTGANCPITFNNQTDLQHAGVLLALPALISQGLLRYENEFNLRAPDLGGFKMIPIYSLRLDLSQGI